ncbi:MAG TPA: amino acid permease [Chitinophagaceae bacterium]|nr:amino acid permease [Chitinophagaceae bacterium]
MESPGKSGIPESRQLSRSLGLGLVIVMVISNIIGSGVYKKIAPMAAELHSSGWVLVCWVVAGIISLLGSLCNAEVAGLLADTGGDYVYYKKIYNRFFAFLFGWSLFTVIQTAAISSLAYVFAQSLNSMVRLPPLLSSWSHYSIAGIFFPFADLQVKLTAILVILLFTWFNSRGIRRGAALSTVILLLVFAGIFTIIVFGLSSHQAHVAGVFNLKQDPGRPVGFRSVFTAILSAFWAYQGWATIGYIGGEVKNARRLIPIGMALGMALVIITYLLINTTYLSLLSIPQLEAIYQSNNGIAAVEAVRVFWGTPGVVFISLLIAMTTLGCVHATILVSARTYFAMAREGLFFRRIGRLNDRQVPRNSLWMQGIWACLLVFSGTFDQLTDMIIFSVFLFYAATTLGVFILRVKMPQAPRTFRVWGYPVIPALVLVFCMALFVNTLFTRPREAAVGLILMFSGIPFYFWFRKKYPAQAASPDQDQ